MRCLRDSLLLTSEEGRAIVRLYEHYNPLISSLIKNDPDLENEIKEIIDSLFPFINLLFDDNIMPH